MTEMSRERREELERQVQAEDGWTKYGQIPIGCGEIRALLRDSAWRERVEWQDLGLVADDILSNLHGRRGFRQTMDEMAEEAKEELREEIVQLIWLAIVDTGDEEGV